MANENENIGSIVAEMRHGLDKSWHEIDREWVHSLADRLEAAWKLEKETWETLHEVAVQMLEQTRAESDRRVEEVVKYGNAAAMRDALESVRNWCYNKLNNTSYQVTIEGLLSIVNSALSAPPRQCDVGTAEDQARRFYAYYSIHNPPSYAACLAWAQRPYEEGDRNA